MGLAEHEFDVAPELLTALTRGVRGPLAERAMQYVSNVAGSLEEIRESERRERLREQVDGVRGRVDSALNGAEAAVRSVADRGKMDRATVGRTSVGGPGRIGESSGPGELGPGRRGGGITIGKHGFIPGVSIGDFLTGLEIGGGEAGRGDGWGRPLSPVEAAASAVGVAAKLVENNIARGNPIGRIAEENRVFIDAMSRVMGTLPVGATVGFLPEEYLELLNDEVTRETFIEALRQFRARPQPMPKPDEDQGIGISPVTVAAVLRNVLAGGGLVAPPENDAGTGFVRAPAIVDAVDNSDESYFASGSVGTTVRWWGLNLIDPIPE